MRLGDVKAALNLISQALPNYSLITENAEFEYQVSGRGSATSVQRLQLQNSFWCHRSSLKLFTSRPLGSEPVVIKMTA